MSSIRCRIGWHDWSENRGGILICRRDGCERAKTFGLQGSMRKQQFEQELYEKYQQFEERDS